MQRPVLKLNHGGSYEVPAKSPGTKAKTVEAELVEGEDSPTYLLLKACFKQLKDYLRQLLGDQFREVSVRLDKFNERVTVGLIEPLDGLVATVRQAANHVLKHFPSLRFDAHALVISHA